jgi:light-regulated signal transduction histidine kinase (bacteriophytochrome)
VEEVLSDLEVRIEKTSAKIEVSSLPTVVADSTQMRQLFQNLIGNALKFHKPAIPPVVKVYELKEVSAGFIAFVIEDNGIGIDALHFDKIFGIFQRLHGKSEYEGSGIGLAICKKIAERHGGSIQVESEIGTGTKFIVRLALTDEVLR